MDALEVSKYIISVKKKDMRQTIPIDLINEKSVDNIKNRLMEKKAV